MSINFIALAYENIRPLQPKRRWKGSPAPEKQGGKEQFASLSSECMNKGCTQENRIMRNMYGCFFCAAQ